MTIKDLLNIIEGLPEDTQIIVAKDKEGNRFSPLTDIVIGDYEPATTWSGDFTYSEEDNIPHDKCNAICMWPVS